MIPKSEPKNKMKLLPAILLLSFIPFLSFAQLKNDLERQNLKGEIKSVTEKEYNATGDSLMWKSISNYNDTGNQVDFYTYSPDNTLLSKSIFNYNDSGRLVDIKRYKADGTLNVRTTCRYDMKGNMVEENNYDNQNILFMTAKSRYDMKGNRVVKDCMNEYGILYLKTNYQNDKHGREIEAKEYDSHHGLKFTTSYDYESMDKNGNWRKRTTYKNDDPHTITIREFEYN